MGSMSNDNNTSLKVLIVGGGLVGLSAAIALRQAGHDVTIFEKSSFSHEAGAAITIHTHATRILKHWGLDLAAAGCDAYKRQWARSAANLKELKPPIEIDTEKAFNVPGLTTHRADIHTALRELALDDKGPGTPAKLRLSSTVASYDGDNATITLADGTTVNGDLLVLADGLHSKGAEYVNGRPCPIIASPHTVTRFMVDTTAIRSDPVTAPVVPFDNAIDIFTSDDRYLVKYSCRNNSLQNFGLYVHSPVPSMTDDVSSTATQTTGHDRHVSRADLLDTMKKGNFSPSILGLADKVSEVLPLWRCFHRDPTAQHVRGKCVVIGDAGHPMLPHRGLGYSTGAQDAAALGVLFDSSTLTTSDRSKEVKDRLQMYEQLRAGVVGCVQLYCSVDLTADCGVMWPECKKWVESLPEEYQRVGKEYGGLPKDLNDFPKDTIGVYVWGWKYDVMKGARGLMRERGISIEG